MFLNKNKKTNKCKYYGNIKKRLNLNFEFIILEIYNNKVIILVPFRSNLSKIYVI